jgi:hypothetical protein
MGRVDRAQLGTGGEVWARTRSPTLERDSPTPAGFTRSTLPMKGREKSYFTGTWSTWGQTAANRASSSAPPAFFGVWARQSFGIANWAEGL